MEENVILCRSADYTIGVLLLLYDLYQNKPRPYFMWNLYFRTKLKLLNCIENKYCTSYDVKETPIHRREGEEISLTSVGWCNNEQHKANFDRKIAVFHLKTHGKQYCCYILSSKNVNYNCLEWLGTVYLIPKTISIIIIKLVQITFWRWRCTNDIPDEIMLEAQSVTVKINK